MSREIVERLTEIRATRPEAIAEALAGHERRPLLGETGTLFLLVADHPACGIGEVGEDPAAEIVYGGAVPRRETEVVKGWARCD